MEHIPIYNASQLMYVRVKTNEGTKKYLGQGDHTLILR